MEIHELYYAYADAVDVGDIGRRIGLFTADGAFSSYVSNHIPESMTTLRARLRGPRPRRIGGHFISNIVITRTPDGAKGTCYALLRPDNPDVKGRFIVEPAFYVDTLRKTREGWRFRTREVYQANESLTPDESLAAEHRHGG